MEQIETFFDERLNHSCLYCGEQEESRDHVPPKVMLDPPYPENLPVVPCCRDCNNVKGADEEFLACMIECVILGTTTPCLEMRAVVRASLTRHARMRSSIQERMTTDEKGAVTTSIPIDRVTRILRRFAAAHYWHEKSEIYDVDDWQVMFGPIHVLDRESRWEFEVLSGSGNVASWPEVGSRAFRRAAERTVSGKDFDPWLVVQPGRYRYLVSPSSAEVRIVISDYLAVRALISE
jgi:hypothetical protein